MPVGPASGDDDGLPRDFSNLSFRQQAALAIVAQAPTRAEAARLLGVGKSTLRRWFTNPSFRRQVDLVRYESAAGVSQELQKLLPLCISVFADAMHSPDPALRLRAARYALSLVVRQSDTDKLVEDLQDLQHLSRSVKGSKA
ncbi:MAG: hypothetical protein OXI91_05280 [Chloroflexota bacterium]|nr:hypothetical protein [Chloroflexota bacterium]